MNNSRNYPPPLKPTLENLLQAICVVNRHAKTATNPKFLYKLKNDSLQKLIREGKARKIGLHFSNNPKFSQQQSDLLIECQQYTFHLPPSKKDFEELPHLGSLNQNIRNPKSTLSLTQAKKLLSQYTGLKEAATNNMPRQKKYQKPIFKKLGESY
ncbi:MAG TPA: YkyB family protein [Niallia sp.]|nr:YkyB family protein [Niallia sp.]